MEVELRQFIFGTAGPVISDGVSEEVKLVCTNGMPHLKPRSKKPGPDHSLLTILPGHGGGERGGRASDTCPLSRRWFSYCCRIHHFPPTRGIEQTFQSNTPLTLPDRPNLGLAPASGPVSRRYYALPILLTLFIYQVKQWVEIPGTKEGLDDESMHWHSLITAAKTPLSPMSLLYRLSICRWCLYVVSWNGTLCGEI